MNIHHICITTGRSVKVWDVSHLLPWLRYDAENIPSGGDRSENARRVNLSLWIMTIHPSGTVGLYNQSVHYHPSLPVEEASHSVEHSWKGLYSDFFSTYCMWKSSWLLGVNVDKEEMYGLFSFLQGRLLASLLFKPIHCRQHVMGLHKLSLCDWLGVQWQFCTFKRPCAACLLA